jgi:outer membrane biosynthesis protein TonB
VAKKRGRPKKEKPMADQSPPQKQQPPQQPQPAQQPAQGQPQPQQGAPQLAAQHQQALAAAGIDWSKLQALPWAQIFALLQAVMQILAAKGPPTP